MRNNIAAKEKKTGKFQYHIQPQVFWIASAFILGFVAITIPLQSVFAGTFKMLFGGAMEYFGWFLILTVNVVLFYCFFLIVFYSFVIISVLYLFYEQGFRFNQS